MTRDGDRGNIDCMGRYRIKSPARRKLQRVHYPAATIAYYGPDDSRASKVAVGVITHEGAEPIMQSWFDETGDIRDNRAVRASILAFLAAHQATETVIETSRIIGCPHQEGIDYPDGESCPQCPFWIARDRFSGPLLM